MITATMKDTGQVFEGADARAVVSAMRDNDWNAVEKKRDYMVEVADRVEAMTGMRPDTESADTFLADLTTLDLVELVVQGDPHRAAEQDAEAYHQQQDEDAQR